MSEKFSGFPGIWTFIAECAIELERLHPGEEWDDEVHNGWIETCEAIGDLILVLDDVTPAADLVAKALKKS